MQRVMKNILLIAVGGGLAYYTYSSIVDKGKRLSDDQHVVIVGGGYGGVRLAKQLQGRGNYTLIDGRDVMHHNMAALRAAVEPGFSKKSIIPYRNAFSDNFVQGKVVGIDVDNKQVHVENTMAPIPYTQLVLATGANGPFPGKCSLDSSSSKMAQMYEDFVGEIAKAKKIVIVGGGPVGVELAGEIATDYPDQKEVTVVQNSNVFVSPVLIPKAQEEIAKKFEAKKINGVLGEKVSNLSELPVNKTTPGLKVQLSSGKTLDADLVVPCFGSTVNTGAYKDSLGVSMNEKGQLKVDSFLQVQGVPDVFAIGDCNNYDVMKLATEAQAQATSAYDNLMNIAKGKPLVPYTPPAFKMCVPIGRDGGISQAGSKIMGDFLTKMIKAKDVFVKMQWGEFGLKPPK